MTDDFEAPDEEPEYNLVMPFVVAASNGGPYEDAPLVAGWRLGALEAQLRIAEQFGLDVPDQTLYPDDAPQVDLLAMRFDYTVKVKSYDEHWSIYNFTRNGFTSRAERDAETVRTALLGCFNEGSLYTYEEVAQRMNEWADAIDGSNPDAL